MWKLDPLILTVGISMQLQWDPLMRDQYKGAIIANLWFFSFLFLKINKSKLLKVVLWDRDVKAMCSLTKSK